MGGLVWGAWYRGSGMGGLARGAWYRGSEIGRGLVWGPRMGGLIWGAWDCRERSKPCSHNSRTEVGHRSRSFKLLSLLPNFL